MTEQAGANQNTILVSSAIPKEAQTQQFFLYNKKTISGTALNKVKISIQYAFRKRHEINPNQYAW